MRIAGASDGGWMPVDLTDVARAILALRGSATAARLRPERASAARQQPAPAR